MIPRGPGRVPFGYREVEPGGLEVDASEQQAIARARRLHTEGRSLRQIAEILDEEGFETRTRTAWTMGRVQGLLRAPSPEDLVATHERLTLMRRIVRELRQRGPMEVGDIAKLVGETGEETYESVRLLERRHRAAVDGDGLGAVVRLIGRGRSRRSAS